MKVNTMKSFYTKSAAIVATLATSSMAFAAGGPSAGDLSNLTPDVSTILTAIGGVGVVILGVALAQKGFDKVKHFLNKL